MPKTIRLFATLTILAFAVVASAACAQSKDDTDKSDKAKESSSRPEGFKAEQQSSKGSVTVGGKSIAYDAYAGTIVVHPTDWDDVAQNRDKDDKDLETQAKSAQDAYDAATHAFTAGTATNLDVLTAQNTALSAQLRLDNERYNLKLTYLALLRAAGVLDRTAIDQISTQRPVTTLPNTAPPKNSSRSLLFFTPLRMFCATDLWRKAILYKAKLPGTKPSKFFKTFTYFLFGDK